MTNALDQLIGSTAYDPAGARIGKIKTLYLDERTAQPLWATVHGGLFGLSHALVPMAGAQTDGDSVMVLVSKDDVKSAPHLSVADQISPQQEEQLLAHYHLQPIQPPGRHEAPETPFSAT